MERTVTYTKGNYKISFRLSSRSLYTGWGDLIHITELQYKAMYVWQTYNNEG